ncbi:hypothetical protein B2J93_5994 [Marssonina coronariae]|uniref:Uncharacterized protein n=1 Tax=Diplocarpon coronariae TaxID=2795749 RepID=A0A218Z8E8_9HELO|nr:hypothetical protein B2J93_5994 [Marssonina coronariae]
MRRRGCLPAAPIPRSSRLSNRSRGVSGETSRSATARHGVETGHRWIWSSVKKGSPVESPRVEQTGSRCLGAGGLADGSRGQDDIQGRPAAARDAEAWHAEPRRPPNMPGWPGPPRVPPFGAGDGRAGANSDGAPAAHSAGAARRGALERQPPSTRAEGAGREGPRNPSRLPARESRPDIPLDDSGRRRSELRRLHAQIPEHMPPRWPGTPNAVLRTTSLGGPRPEGQMGMAARLDQQLGGYDGRVGSPANFHLQSRSPKMLCFGYHLSPISPGMISIVQTTPGGTRWPAPPDSLPPALPCPAPKVRKTVISSLPYPASLPLKVSRLPMMLE